MSRWKRDGQTSTPARLAVKLSIVALLALIVIFCQAQAEDYTGYTEYDGRAAKLQLSFAGSAANPTVSGRLLVDPVCESGIHLTGVDLTLTGAATGPWEDPATTISGSWTGGDTNPCTGAPITNDPSFPVAGGFVITMQGEKVVKLVRMPTGYGYIFASKGFVYTSSESLAPGSSSTYVDSGTADLMITNLSVPTGMKPGTTARIEVAFSNQGAGDAGPFDVYAYAFSKQNYQYSIKADPISITGIGAGESKTTTLIMAIPSDAPSGPWDVKVAVDNSNYAGSGSVEETDENNNERWKRNVLEPEIQSSADSSSGEDVSETNATAEPILIFELNTLGGVENDPPNTSKFTLDRTYLITEIRTYHWNYGQGQIPGAIGIQDEEGNVLEVIFATGLEGMGGVPNAYWSVQPNLELQPGVYSIIDSDPSTWSQNWETGGRGIVWVYGLEVSESKPSGSEDVTSGQLSQQKDLESVPISETQGSYEGDTSTAEYWLDLGNEAFLMGKYEEALGCFEWAQEINPENYDALLAKGGALLALERYLEAYYCAQEALAIDGANCSAWYLKGDALDGLGRHDEADRAWEQAKSLDPDN